MELKNKRRRHICRVLRVLSLLVCAVCIVFTAFVCASLLFSLFLYMPVAFAAFCASVVFGLGAYRLADWLRGL